MEPVSIGPDGRCQTLFDEMFQVVAPLCRTTINASPRHWPPAHHFVISTAQQPPDQRGAGRNQVLEKAMSFRYRVATVFGGSGFIGRHLIKRLAKTGTIIRVATRHPSSANFLRTNGSVGQIIPIAVNVNDDASVAAAVRDADIVINLIGILYVSGGNTFHGTQGEAPGRIARAAKAAGAQRFIQISAIGADAGSTSEYARSKAA